MTSNQKIQFIKEVNANLHELDVYAGGSRSSQLDCCGRMAAIFLVSGGRGMKTVKVVFIPTNVKKTSWYLKLQAKYPTFF